MAKTSKKHILNSRHLEVIIVFFKGALINVITNVVNNGLVFLSNYRFSFFPYNLPSGSSDRFKPRARSARRDRASDRVSRMGGWVDGWTEIKKVL